MFGSTIEFCIQNFSKEYKSMSNSNFKNFILDDGSLHSFKKELHSVSSEDYKKIVNNSIVNENTITTPIYPTAENHLPELLEFLSQDKNFLKHKNILLFANNIDAAELNMLFQYEKIAVGLDQTIDIFCSSNNNEFTKWNKSYTYWKDMQPWELREWFSIFYPTWITEYIDSKMQVDASFLKIANTDMLFSPVETINKIFNFCNLTRNQNNLEDFLNTWYTKQTYIVDQQKKCNSIINDTLNQTYQEWNCLNFIQEAIIQKKLRDRGYELQCWNLNNFPTNTKTLYDLIEKF